MRGGFLAASTSMAALAESVSQFVEQSKDQPFFVTLALGDPHPNGIDGMNGVDGDDAEIFVYAPDGRVRLREQAKIGINSQASFINRSV